MRCILRPAIRLRQPMTDNVAQQLQLDILSPPMAEWAPVTSRTL